MKSTSSPRALQTVLIALAVVLLVVGVVQLNAVEKRISTQEQQLRSLGESSERMVGELKRLKGNGAASTEKVNSNVGTASVPSSEDCETDPVLHPEVPNFLVNHDTHWPAAGANLGGALTKGWPSGDPKGFNSLLENSAELQEDVFNYVDALIADRNKWTDPDKWHGELACRVEVTDDFREYTIYLRKGVRWHAPSGINLKSKEYAWLDRPHEVTAEDLAFTFEMLLNPQVENGFLKNYYADLQSWKVVNSHTLVVRWKKKVVNSIAFTLNLAPIPKFLLAYDERGVPFPKETLGLRFNQHWYNNKGYVGAGPYRLSEYVPGNKLVLERNEDYFGSKPAIKRVVHPIYTDPNLTLLKLKAGELSLGRLRASQYREEIQRYQGQPQSALPKNSPFFDGRINCRTLDAFGYRYIGWNGDHPIFSDPRVRMAMTLALNRKEIIERIFVGLGEVAIGPFLPSTGGLDTTVDPLNFDLARARKVLSDAGWADTDGNGLIDKAIKGKRTQFEFTLLIYGSSPEYTALANIFKEDLLKIGVKLNVTSAEWSLMQKRMDEKNFDAFTGGWALPWEVDAFQIWHSSQADIPKGSNRVGFRSKEADKLIEQLRETFDPEERRVLLRKIHRLIYESHVYSFIMTSKEVFCTSRDVKDVVFAKVRPTTDFRPWSVAQSQ
ncbi:MAG: ABC transporter substrate-binding protein [Polyangiaceae bacterium]|nr:ABC transporter substrate-binding protein [Polyangiaceae bacterium]